MNIVMIVTSEDSLELWIQSKTYGRDPGLTKSLQTFHCPMSSTLGYLVTQKMPGLTVEDVQTITMVICCDYSAGLVLLQLLGEIYMVLYVTTISDVVAAYCIQSISVKVLMEIVRLLRTVKLVFHCTSVCVLGCALASVPLPLALWYSADLHPLYL